MLLILNYGIFLIPKKKIFFSKSGRWKNKNIPFYLVLPAPHFCSSLSLNPYIFSLCHIDLRLKCAVHQTSCKAIPPVILSSALSTSQTRQVLNRLSCPAQGAELRTHCPACFSLSKSGSVLDWWVERADFWGLFVPSTNMLGMSWPK